MYRRYAEEFVEALGLCPWATRARREGSTRVEVDFGTAPSAATAEQLARLGREPDVLVALVLFPRVRASRKAWEREVSALRERLGSSACFALAAFHPDARPHTESAARLVPFIRRTPDPTVQAIRFSALDAVRRREDRGSRFVDPATLDLGALLASEPPRPALHERVAETNLATLEAHGLGRAAALLDAIHADRQRSYP